MHPFGELSGQRRQLAEALRVLRVNAGLSGEQLAKRLQVSQSRVSRIELAQQAAAPGLVRCWIEATGAPEDRAADLVGWAEAAVTESVLLRTSRSRGLAQLQRDSLEFEATSKTILEFDPVLIPGLLQVPEYARRVFIAGKPLLSPGELAAAVAGRMERQLALYEGATRLSSLSPSGIALVGRPTECHARSARSDHCARFHGHGADSYNPAGYRGRRVARARVCCVRGPSRRRPRGDR